jgi:hypothetical protein
MSKAETAYKKIAASLAAEGVADSKMFGMPTLKINGKAFAGLYDDAMTFKLTGSEHHRALALNGAKLFEPMAGRPMKEWVQVPVGASKEWPALAQASLTYVSKPKK